MFHWLGGPIGSIRNIIVFISPPTVYVVFKELGIGTVLNIELFL